MAFGAVAQTVGDEREQLRRHRDWPAARRSIDGAPFTVGLVVRQQGVEPVRFVQGRTRGGIEGRPIRAVEDNGER